MFKTEYKYRTTSISHNYCCPKDSMKLCQITPAEHTHAYLFHVLTAVLTCKFKINATRLCWDATLYNVTLATSRCLYLSNQEKRAGKEDTVFEVLPNMPLLVVCNQNGGKVECKTCRIFYILQLWYHKGLSTN